MKFEVDGQTNKTLSKTFHLFSQMCVILFAMDQILYYETKVYESEEIKNLSFAVELIKIAVRFVNEELIKSNLSVNY